MFSKLYYFQTKGTITNLQTFALRIVSSEFLMIFSSYVIFFGVFEFIYLYLFNFANKHLNAENTYIDNGREHATAFANYSGPLYIRYNITNTFN
jgi:hypothetical protein